MVLICIMLEYLSIFLSVPFILALVKIKNRIDGMDEEKWNDYFSSTGIQEYKKKIAVVTGLPMVLCGFINYLCLCKKYKKKQAASISFSIFTFFTFMRIMKYAKHSDEIDEKIWGIKKACKEETDRETLNE